MTDVPIMAKAPIVVFAHVHYPDIWHDMSVLVSERLTLPFRLILTSSHPQDQIAIPRTPSLLSVRFLPAENRGRDILPFLRALAASEDFEFGLKLHTKKSPQREDGAYWRADILDSLLPPMRGVDAIVAHMRADPRIGVVTPAGFCLSVRPWMLENAAAMHRVMSTLGAELTETLLDDAFFAAGSMFWFRRAALAGLEDQSLPDLFEAEAGQFDGTSAHAMERLFPVEARRQGYVSLAMPALMASDPDMPLAELLELARLHADMPSRYFPAPYVPALPLGAVSRAPVASTRLKDALASIYRASLPVGLRRTLRHLLGRRT